MPSHPIPLGVITGPTASGKTGLGIELAERFGAEVVSADSMQVYRRLDIGTAKPTAVERARVPHHLLDVADPAEAFDTVRFQELADAAIARIHAAGRRVLVVGGTGLYLRILLYGLADVPGPDPERRRRLEAEAEAWGNIALHSRLADLDPAAARRIHVSDRFRLVRALEVIESTGRPISELQGEHRFARARYPHRILALELPREELRARILRRAEAMVAAGLLGEVRALLRDGYSPELRPLRGFGYREPVRCVLGERSEEGLAEAMARDTARYAKRQATWLRSERGVEWLVPDAGEAARRFAALWGSGERE
ncbi:MAG: tRNA (adenosine(37)-N6)-dimethylallyltransferase MiaA [Deltaproteobacteria bacterium]|nr:tRNA (adenosine(37)-N6)-dimethylallyltransferase MiaA [Deltaproteobacteria bacterium]